MHISEAAIDTVVSHGELFVINAEKVEDGGVEVVAGGDVLRGLITDVVADAVGDAGLDACAPEPAHKGAAIMIGSAPEGSIARREGSIACPQHAVTLGSG